MNLTTAISRNSLLLAIFAIATASLLSLTYSATKNRINQVERQQEAKALAELMQSIDYDNDLLNSYFLLTDSETQQLNVDIDSKAYFATFKGQVKAVIIPSVATDGYSGNIRMLIGINAQGRISGLRVTSHKETPGLGDKVSLSKSPWVLSFNNKGFDNLPSGQWAVKKDGGQFDAFTGATITPRSIVNQAKHTLELFHERQQSWFSHHGSTTLDP